MPFTAELSRFLFHWLTTWVILAVVFYIAADLLQRYLYETVIEKMAWRVVAVTPILAAVLVKWPLSFDQLFFSIPTLIAEAVLWFLACWLGLRFLLPHAAAAGLIAVVTIAPITSSSIDSLMQKAYPPAATAPAETPIRQSTPAATSTPSGTAGPSPGQPASK